MANEVIFTTDVGGSGLRVTDDGGPDGLDNDGHRVRFVPALAQVVENEILDLLEDETVNTLSDERKRKEV